MAVGELAGSRILLLASLTVSIPSCTPILKTFHTTHLFLMKLAVFYVAGLTLGHGLFPRGSPQSPDSQGTSSSASPSRSSIPEPPAPQTVKTKSMVDMFAKANQKAAKAERIASTTRQRYHDTAADFQNRYSVAHHKYRTDMKNPAVSVEKLYTHRRQADNLIKKVGKAQKNLANAYAKASVATEEAGITHRVERNSKKAESTAAHFFATRMTYKTSKDILKAKHLPEIAMRTRARGKPGAMEKADAIDAEATKAANRQKLNEYVMHTTTKRFKDLRHSGGRDTESEASSSSS